MGVELEGHMVSLDRHGNGLLRDCVQQRVLVTVGHVFEADDAALRDAGRAVGRRADPAPRLVRVAVLGADRGTLLVPESAVHLPAPAAEVPLLFRAIHELLFGERQKLAGRDLPSALQGANARKCPARAALRLVLHLLHGALGPPIHGLRQRHAAAHVRAEVRQTAPCLLRARPQTQARLCELLPRQVGELVQAKRVAVPLGVLGPDELVIGNEGRKSGLLLDLLVNLTEVPLELLEGARRAQDRPLGRGERAAARGPGDGAGHAAHGAARIFARLQAPRLDTLGGEKA
mmetsp:Transcript_20670/g.61884  ORF Transcript_20670/g.61884 Transcript_20670/m.61884 type:complete len:289 (-) Transcript_20670:14-880(-)